MHFEARPNSDGLPDWATRLYPATFNTNAAAVRAQLAKVALGVRSERRCMFSALRHGDRRGVAGHRRQLDRLLTWQRNCETQLRLIDARAQRLATEIRKAA